MFLIQKSIEASDQLMFHFCAINNTRTKNFTNTTISTPWCNFSNMYTFLRNTHTIFES